MKTSKIIATVLFTMISLANITRGENIKFGLDWNWGASTVAPGMTTTSYVIGYRFTAYKDIDAAKAILYANSVTGTPEAKAELYADNGSGMPGTLLASGTQAFTSNGINTISFSSSYTLQTGSVYHLLFSKTNSTSDTYTLGQSAGNPGVHTIDGSPDSNYARMWSSSGVANVSANSAYAGLFGVANSDDSDAMGTPYNGASVLNLGGSAWVGQKFLYDQQSGTVDDITMRLKRVAATTDDLRVHIVDADTNAEVFSDVLVASGQMNPGEYGNVTLTIDSNNPTLQNGKEYYLMLESTGAINGNFQLIADGLNANSGILNLESFQGISGNGTGYVVTASSASSEIMPVSYNGQASDALFYMNITVPEPATIGLLAIGSGIAVIMRKRR